LLTRTDPSAPKHRASRTFLVDMRTAGIDVRPLRQITGAAHFNEVFLSECVSRHENIVGEINAGWGPMMTTLSNERTLIGGGQGRTGIEDLIALARDTGRTDDAVIRQELAKAYSRMQIQTYSGTACAPRRCGVSSPAPRVR
jgi:alkylation response protein AidB-like acyl-CoA dehydrogenase